MPWEAIFWQGLWERLQTQFADWLPGLVAAILLLIIGWFVARIGQAAVAGLLRRLGLDRLSERAGAANALARLGLSPSLAGLLGRLTYWVLLIVFILAALEALGLASVSLLLGELVGFLPGLVAAILILVLGGLFARIAGDTVTAMSTGAGVRDGALLGQITRVGIFVVAAIVALDQLGLETRFLTTILLILIAAFALALGIAFGLGNRSLTRNIMAGYHAKENFSPGQLLQIGQRRGRILAIGVAKTQLKTTEGILSIPNEELLKRSVLVIDDEVATGGEL